MRRALLPAILLVTTLVAPAVNAGSEMHDFITFEERSARYLAFENATIASVTMKRCCHMTTQVSAELATQSGSAVAEADYTETQRTVHFTDPIQTNDVSVPVTNDGVEEPVESFTARLQNPTGGATLGNPHDATVFIVDDDGAPRLSFLLSSDRVFENRLTLNVMIVRSGDPSVPVSVQWATVAGTATEGDDYVANGGTLNFAATERRKTIQLRTVDDEESEGSETFSLALSDPGGATLVDPSTLEVEIADDETPTSDTEPPVTAFHQPLHDRTYRARDLTDILVFADDAGSGVAEVHIALRKKLRSGACRWFVHRTRSFERGPCSDKRWIQRPGAETVIYSLGGRLAPSTRGKRVRYYKAWSRGVDELGNVETAFRTTRNVSRFDIRS